MNHLLILPILLPAVVACVLTIAARKDMVLARVFGIGSSVCLLLLGGWLLALASDGEIRTYALGNWAAPFGIVLVLDRLSALMLVLTAGLAFFVLLYCINGCDRLGEHFHPLMQFQLMGLNGAFLTGDLFNLFVFFEIMLMASFGLMVHGGGGRRMRAALQYVVVNLVGSSIFLFAIGLLYGVTGTLNMADLAVKCQQVVPRDQALLYAGAGLLLVVFAIKAAVVPLQFWLPVAYSSAAAPVAAFFSIMTKVGAYAILRMFSLAFLGDGDQVTRFASHWLVPAATVTLVVGMVGVVAARRLGQQASFAALGSMGMLLVSASTFTIPSHAAALYYLLHSTLAIALLFLLVDAVSVRRIGYGDRLILAPRFPGTGLLSAAFFITAIAVIGLPPLSGFVGKLMIMQALEGHPGWQLIWAAILGTSLLGIIGFAFSGTQIFWKSGQLASEPLEVEPVPIALPLVVIGLLIAVLAVLTAAAGPVYGFLESTAQQILTPELYQDAVLGLTNRAETP